MIDRTVLNLPRLPARLNSAQTAALLGIQEHDVPVAVRVRIIRPLGGRDLARSTVKYFATAEILRVGQDEKLLSQLTSAISKYWQNKNARRRTQRELQHAA